MNSGRLLAFDYGLARIGVAVCDRDRILATPLEYIPNTAAEEFNLILPKIQSLIAEYEPVALLIGDPKNLNGSNSTSSTAAHNFGIALEIFQLPIHFIDERLTSISANSILREQGVNQKSGRGKVDSISAALILEAGMKKI
jgi:putative Holliday junction resolvase